MSSVRAVAVRMMSVGLAQFHRVAMSMRSVSVVNVKMSPMRMVHFQQVTLRKVTIGIIYRCDRAFGVRDYGYIPCVVEKL